MKDKRGKKSVEKGTTGVDEKDGNSGGGREKTRDVGRCRMLTVGIS